MNVGAVKSLKNVAEGINMKSWPDKLRQLPVDILKREIEKQKSKIAIAQKDLKTMERILNENVVAKNIPE